MSSKKLTLDEIIELFEYEIAERQAFVKLLLKIREYYLEKGWPL